MAKMAIRGHSDDLRIIVSIVVMFSLGAAIILIFDYLNLFGDISSRINYDFQSIFISFLSALMLFIIAYKLIDKRSIERREKELANKRHVAKSILLGIYHDCINSLILIDEKTFQKLIPNRIKPNEPLADNTFVNSFKNMPFANEGILMSLFCSGALDGSYLEKYLDIKTRFSEEVNL